MSCGGWRSVTSRCCPRRESRLVSHTPGRVDEEHQVSRARVVPFFATQPAATVLLEACGSAHHWGRTLTDLGHTGRRLPPHEPRRYGRRNKTDRTDARALLEKSAPS